MKVSDIVKDDRMKFNIYTYKDVDYYVTEYFSEEFLQSLVQGRNLQAQQVCSLIICKNNEISKCRFQSLTWLIAQRPKIKRYMITPAFAIIRIK